MKNFYSTIKTLAKTVVTTGALLLGYAQAQTTLSPGGIVFTSYDSTSTSVDVFSFVLLAPISSGTQISFTDRGYQGGSAWQPAGSTESAVTWTSGTALPAGTEVYISALSASVYNPSTSTSTPNGTVALTDGTSSNGLVLSSVGDQIIAFQGGNGSVTGANVTCIAGINYFYTAGSTTAAWNSDAVGSPNASLMPPGLTGGTNAFYTGPVSGVTVARSGKFNCTGVPTSTVANIRTAVMNNANWTLSTAAGSQYSGCTFLASNPVITANPANRTICAGGTTTFTVSASGATSYQWYQNSGSGFIALTNTAPYSGVTTNTLTITGVTSAMNGYQYRAVASNGAGSATSTAASLTVASISTTGSKTDISCNGGSNGVATVVPSGGVAPYTYSWAPAGGTAATATGLAAGTYTVTVTDNLGCQTTRTFTINQPASAVSGTTVVTNVACNGASNGAINLTPAGGTAPYTFNWGGGITTEDRTGLAAGTYTVIITDANGCTATVNATVTQPASAVSGTTVVTNVACNGASNGAINLTPAGGTAPYTFNWGGGITTEDRTGLAAGTYTVIITDANGCTATVNATVTQPASAVSGTTVVTNVACNGASNGAINLTPAGGTAPYTFNWGGGITTEDRTGLAAGTYTVIITDANGCTATVNATVTQPASAVSGTTVVTNVACNGASNGAINLTPAGGTAPYTFNWGGGITTEDRTGLAAGTYTVIITDANGCTATVNATVTQPASAVSGTTVVTNVACNGASNGAINLTPAGGTAPYTFNWGGGITTEDRTGLAAGTYTVIITDANGCTATVSRTVTQPTALAATTSQTNIACNGGSTGVATINVSGGTAPYTYSWSPSGGTAATATGLSAGTYTVTVTDANACTLTRTFTITQPTALAATTSQTNIACNGGSTGVATINVSGGTAPYTYSWSPSGGTAATATGLSAGTYIVTVTDANACTLTRTFTITQPTALAATTSQTNIACNGGSTGVATINVSGGTAPYTYSWSPSGGTAATATGLSAGTYTVTVTDANACTLTRTFTITQPTALAATTSQTNIACNGGSTGVATINVSGGTAPYTYSWSPSGGTAATATGLSAGTYTVTVTDANACTLTRTFTITQPASAVSGTTVVTNVACNGASNGAINLTPAGGTAPYTFNWGGGITTEDRTGLAAGTYTVIITDANGCTATVNATVTQPASAVSGTTVVTNVACNGASNGAINLTPAGGTAPYTFNWGGGITTEDRTGLAAGTYTVIITDANGCTATVNATVTQPASAVSGTTVVTNVACNGASNGAINLTPAGGTAPYTFNWGGGITTEDRTGLAAGTYTVIITDANGCTATVNATVTQPASAVSGTTVVTNVACNGASNGAINLTPAGGTAPYTFNWGGGITTEDRTGLAAGTYTVIITDANGCTATVNATVTQPASAVSGTTVVTNVACNGASNGAINLTPAGGTAPYTFNWGGGITTEDRTGLAAGTYTVIITDANGCTATVNATVTQPASAVSGTTVVTNVACNGASNGAINLTPAGGTAPYTFNWGGGITTEDRTGLAAGTYTVIITDANGCTATVSRTVTQPTALAATTSQTNIACNGGSTGLATINVSGGTAPYTYSWSPSGGTAATATGLSAGTYTVTVTDANACTLTRTFTITQSVPVAAPTGTSPQNFAPGSTLSALVVTGQNIKWYASSTDAQNHVNSLPLSTALVNNTTYYATQTVGSCESTASLAVLAINSTLGVADNTKTKSQLQIYPNPVRDILNFSGQEVVVKAVIIAADGRKVTEKKLQSGERSIDVNSLPQGMYLIQVFTENGMQTFKFIKK
ncbi:T9SS C-terminal target domain-containing protein [Chryseobacterium shandongense]|uniref:T9SS C-terminal target domain-containing protein n=2 Tax=Chryseobacterium TaxID=59732 RepID=A0AAD1DLI5_9FLAO|nr:T9SS type A sorting domain-containing protein [Chryseobacterium shandongense]AZA86643.1 T9SS C-terminal target domain-containing protein [Chryseobacterium shandongense]AZA95056.1 T9SS C-terminal target domain-containing protein [Chryseobacterium shandongense]